MPWVHSTLEKIALEFKNNQNIFIMSFHPNVWMFGDEVSYLLILKLKSRNSDIKG
jgi:hypothetical protein